MPSDGRPTPVGVTPARLRMPELMSTDIERTEAGSLTYQYE
ncbi:hypothetical protein [Streptomyces sp. NPDC096068]